MFNSKFKTMKKLGIVSVITICSFVFLINAKAVDLGKEFVNYEIVEIEGTDMAKDVEKVWNLTYEGSTKPVSVVKRNSKQGTAYIVQTKYFEVCYLSSSKGFGARNVKSAWSTIPAQMNDAVINSEQMKRQQTLTPSQVDDEMALELIAGYLPELLNTQYKH